MKKESQINVGDKVFVPFELLLVRDSGDFPYYLGHDTSRILANEEMLEQWKKESGCANGSGKTYEDGLNEAWELARKIICSTDRGGLRVSELEEIFSCTDFDRVMANYTPQEAAAKIAEWEKKQEIHVGDVLLDRIAGDIEVIVSRVQNNSIFVIWSDGSCGELKADNFAKTGRHIDIAGLLAQIGGQDDE